MPEFGGRLASFRQKPSLFLYKIVALANKNGVIVNR